MYFFLLLVIHVHVGVFISCMVLGRRRQEDGLDLQLN